MKITISLSDAEAQGYKDYLHEVDNIDKPTKEDIAGEIQNIISGVLNSEREAVSHYIRAAEEKLKQRQMKAI